MALPAAADEPRLDLVVAGHTNIDHFLGVEAFPRPDRTVPLTSDRIELGGTAATIARLAARNGVRTGLVSRVGADFPEPFVAALRREGIDLGGLERVPDVGSPCCYIVLDAHGGQFTLIHQGPMGNARDAPVPERFLAAARWLHLATGDPDWQLRLQAAARTAGGRVAVDPAQEIHYLWDAKRFARLLAGAEIFFANRSELARALSLLRLRRPVQLLERVPLVIMTDGPRGARVFHRAGGFAVPGRPVRGPHRPTGAGDAFRGGFYAGFFEGLPLREAVTRGVRVAAEWIRRPDPGAVRPER